MNAFDDKMLRASSPKKFAAVCGVGAMIGMVTVLLAYFLSRIFNGADFAAMFNLSLVFTFVVGMVNVFAARVRQGPMVLGANLIALWGFADGTENFVGMVLAFTILYALTSAIFYQIFRIKDLRIAAILGLVMVIIVRLMI